jgi:hypothetical protein
MFYFTVVEVELESPFEPALLVIKNFCYISFFKLFLIFIMYENDVCVLMHLSATLLPEDQ